MMVWLKLVHIASIALWAGGLVSLPGLFMRRASSGEGPDLHRLQAMARFLYVAVVSPAAFVAVGSGTALIFVRQTFEPWFSLKLLLVGVMVAVHIVTGLVIVRLFEAGRTYPFWRFLTATALTTALAGTIFLIVLAKPQLPHILPDVLSEPGGLKRLTEPFIPFQRS